MPFHEILFHPIFIKKVAAGVGENPDTLMLAEEPTILLKVGIKLRIYSRESQIYTHQGWFTIERVRVEEHGEVEFVLLRLGRDEDTLRGSRHLLIARKDWTADAPQSRPWKRKLCELLKRGKDAYEPIQRFLPPSPTLSTASLSLQSTLSRSTSTAAEGSTSIEALDSAPASRTSPTTPTATACGDALLRGDNMNRNAE
ncbi:hypothetical protein K466DRAFT_564447 [Polyporus arcularius HHB13444]|uniref:Uncharacterized protein n=1 Tax=Polyporus arcularius HHB13444 TaxID=1314778 RepID=A0A5C3PS44_9APHY|nr:hypothetical protein K466DRAFT_564447 [Polyporus arcularius HHB13444]